MMKLLVIGSGGREHAIAWKLAQSPRVSQVFVAPGNGGTASTAKVENLALTDHAALIAFAQQENIYLTVVGPEAPLAAGIVDAFRAVGLRIFGPTRAAAQLESSKDFAKQFMLRHGIPTARYASFEQPDEARAYVRQHGAPIVIKADGLAAGKGVVVAMHEDEAYAAIDAMLGQGSLGTAGARVVIEECLFGEEASFIVMVDGKHILPMASSQDHKRLLDNDRGPNTGGMGAYSPAPVVTPLIHDKVMREIIEPTVAGMAADGIVFSGFLYAGLMIDDHGNVRTLEFNCRMGDPETQPILLRLQTELLTLFEHATDGTLNTVQAQWDPRCALGVVMAAHGYPDHPRKDDVITGLPAGFERMQVFHAGTRADGRNIYTNGGRVLCVTALGDNVLHAQQAAYRALASIQFAGMQYRQDIGYRAIARAQ